MKRIDLRKVLIGSDFEMFIVDKDKKFVSAIPFIEGTKNNPLPVSDKGHMIQHDGVLFECNVPPVTIDSRDEMWENIQFVIEQGKEKLPENLQLECCTNGTFEEKELEDPEAKVAGCSASFCAWAGGEMAPKPSFDATNDRCAGLHLHYSYPGCNVENGMRLIRILDVNLAIPLLFVDEDRKRRLLYGQAGDFRYKDFGNVGGIEHRVLSNVVIRDKNIFDFVWEGIKKSFKQFNEGVDYLHYSDRIQEAINNYNLEEAEQLCKELEIDKFELQAA